MAKIYCGKYNEDYGWECSFFYRIKAFSDGISFFKFEVNWDRYLSDHSPRFECSLEIINYHIFDYQFYYLHHRDD